MRAEAESDRVNRPGQCEIRHSWRGGGVCKLFSQSSRSSVQGGQIPSSNTQGKQECRKRQRFRSQVELGKEQREQVMSRANEEVSLKLLQWGLGVARVHFSGSQGREIERALGSPGQLQTQDWVAM